MGARNRVGIWLSYRPARLHRLAESILGLLENIKIRALAVRYVKEGCRTGPPGWESIPGLLKSFTNTGSVPVF
jgi:hypothetical protein